MTYKLPEYKAPDFTREIFVNAPDVLQKEVVKEGVAPDDYHAMSVYPEYFKINGEWYLPKQSRMDCVPVVNGTEITIKEQRNLKRGDMVVIGRTEDGSEGIYLYNKGFVDANTSSENFAFRSGRSRETSYSKDYDELYELLKYEKENDGYIVWVLGPAVSFDKDARDNLSMLIEKGYVNAVLAGNALATHDLEGAYLKTALGQHIYTQEGMKNGHYNHLDTINKVRKYGSIKEFIKQEDINDGIMSTLVKNNIPFVLAGSIRDDGPLPEVIKNVYEAQDEMRSHLKKATTLIGLATQLHTIASGNMTPSYTVKNGVVRNVFIYSVDISEFVVNKLRDRGTLEVKTFVTNVQDFIVNVNKNL